MMWCELTVTVKLTRIQKKRGVNTETQREGSDMHTKKQRGGYRA